MSRRLLISSLPGESRAVWLAGERLVDLVIQRADRPSRLGSIYHGRVAKVDKSLDAAFVELGLARPGLLPLSEGPGRRLSEGDAVVVRVLREAAAEKGLRLSARIKDPPPDLAARAGAEKPPALLLRGDDPIERLLAAGPAPEEIVFDDPEAHRQAKARLAQAGGDLAARLRLDLDPVPLFERAGVEARIEALLQPRVALPSGGFLLIEPVTTLTAIDVNSGRHFGRAGAQEQALAVDLEAAPVIAEQLRLRALSGLIVVDFLALADAGPRREVGKALRRALEADPEPARVYPMTPSGLVEMTRRRGRPPLHELLTEPCGIDGGGRVKGAVTLAFEALRQARREAAARPDARVTITAAPEVVAALQGPAAAARAALEQSLGRPLATAAELALRGAGAQIVLD